MHLYEKAKLEGTVLHPGDYKVEWSGSGPNVELNIVQGRDTVATVPPQVGAENTRTVARRLRKSASVEPNTT